MNVLQKLELLSGAARYDVSCSSSGSSRSDALGCASTGGICHSWSADGRCISLLKILLTNECIYDCAYCVNRRSNDLPRAAFTVDELVSLTIGFYRRNYIEGLFLSSGVYPSPDDTMERMMEVAGRLRKARFGGYIHLKAIPGASLELINKAGLAADRLSVNIELPSEESLNHLAPQKKKAEILTPMRFIGDHWKFSAAEKKKNKRAPSFCPAGHSTQMIIGASPETDRHILSLSSSLYSHYKLKRVYFSAYMPVGDSNRLSPGTQDNLLLREHRLYQADWLIRQYGFAADEIAEESDFLDLSLDPKSSWALRHPERFPIEILRASLDELLRVPGIGHRSARRILQTRKNSNVRITDLGALGVVMKRARHFITCHGKRPKNAAKSHAALLHNLLPADGSKTSKRANGKQLELFTAGQP